MTDREKAAVSLRDAAWLLRNKPAESTLVQRYFLLQEAWDAVRETEAAMQPGLGLRYVLERASLPVAENDLLLGRYDDHVPTGEEEARLQAIWNAEPDNNPVTWRNGGHFTVNAGTLLRDGIPGILQRLRHRLEQEGRKDRRDFLRGMEAIWESVLLYIRRYGEAAEAAGRPDCAGVCRELTLHAPQTFREGLQLLLFVYTVYLIYAGSRVACLTLGRLDVLLLPLYRSDLEAGRLTREEAGYLIDDLSAKMSLHLGRGEHQMAGLSPGYVQTGWTRNPVYESPGYIVIGGVENDGDHRENPLTLLFAGHISPELKNPVYICRYAKGNPQLWEILSEKICRNASVLIYNDETVIPAYRRMGAEPQDAANYTVHPCNWGDVGGGSISLGQAGGSLPVLLRRVLRENREAGSMEEIYAAAEKAYAELLRPVFRRYRQQRRQVCAGIPCFSDCLIDGTAETGCSAASGGAKYPFLYTLLRNVGTAADMLSAVEELVFREKAYTLRQLTDAADRDFADTPELLSACRNAPKYGTDDDRADKNAAELMTRLLDVIDREAVNEEGVRDVYTVNVTINDSNHLWDGAALGATVDGRRKGAPLSENLCGTVGYSKGVTALLNSASRLPFGRICSGALNVRLNKSIVRGEEGPRRIRALTEGYFAKGGMQLQFSFTDTAELRAAQKDPDAYRDLLVRITGYSAVFVDMCHGAQEEFIRREELR